MLIDSQYLKALAAAIGFSDCGIARAESLTDEEYPLGEWLALGYQADMHYMERNAQMRRDPRLLVEGAQSVISLVLPYKPDRQIESSARIAQYAYGEDYHERLKRMMFSLIARLKERLQEYISVPAWGHTVITNQRNLLYGDYLIQGACGARWPGKEPEPMATPIELGSDTFKTWDDVIEYFSRLGGQ